MLRHFLNPPNWFTAASIFCSTYAMALLMVNPDPSAAILTRACVLVVFGAIFDNLDGRVARLTNRSSDFGVQLDSIADILGFGLAPALIAWTWKLHELGMVGMGFTFAYVVCAAFRLARFNVNTGTDAWPFAGHSQGLTSTMSGGILVTAVWVSNGYLAEVVRPTPVGLGLFVLGLGYLMVSSVPFRNFKDLRRNENARRYLAVALAAALTSAIAFDVSLFWGVGAAMYLVVGSIDGLAIAARHGRLGHALLLRDDLVCEADEDDTSVGIDGR